MKSYAFFCVVLIFNFLGLKSQDTKLSNALNPDKNGVYDCIIQLKDNADVSFANRISGKVNKAEFVFHKLKSSAKQQKNIIDYCITNSIPFQSFSIINAVHVKCKVDHLKTIALFQEVAKIHNNSPLRMLEPLEERGIDIGISREPMPEWGIRMIQADSVWKLGYDGKGVVVGGADTGYDWNLSPLRAKYRGFVNDSVVNHSYNWNDAIHVKSPLNNDTLNPCGFNSVIPCDDNNHGTHTMGTMIGSDSINYIGVAPGATWIACRNMERGWGQPSTYLECFEWFLAPTDSMGLNPDPSKAPHVINNSWGCPQMEGCDPSNFYILEDAIKNLKAAGTVVVVSAGNDGPSCNTIENPASIYESSFTIGATRSNDTIWGGSSRGIVSIDGSYRLKPNVTAPGVGVRSVVKGGQFAFYTGTSMAGPHVCGLVALMISANPNLAGEVDVIEDIIESTAVPKISDQICDSLNTLVPNPVYGYGRVNALLAVKKAIEWRNTKIDHIQSIEAYLSPNPSSGLFRVFVENSTETQWFIYDLQGKIISKGNETNDTFELDIRNKINGLYFLELRSREKITTMKLVKVE